MKQFYKGEGGFFQMSREEVYQIAHRVFWPFRKKGESTGSEKPIVKSWKKKEFIINLFELGIDQRNWRFKFVSFYDIIKRLNNRRYLDEKRKKPTNTFFRFLFEVRVALKKYFQTDEAKKRHNFILEVVIDSEGGLELRTSELIKGTKFEVLKYDVIEIFSMDGSVNHTLHFGMEMIDGTLGIKDFGLIMWDRGKDINLLPVEGPKLFLENFLPKTKRNVDLTYISNPINLPHEYHWEIKHNPQLMRGDKIWYRMNHLFKRPFPLVYEDILECTNYYKGLKFAYDGVSTKNKMPYIKIEIHFPLDYKIWEGGVFIEEGFSGRENIEEAERVLKEKSFNEWIENDYRILSLIVEYPNPYFTYSIKWNPPWRKDYPYLK